MAAAFYRCCHISDTGETRGIENFVALSDATWERAHKILADRGWRAFELWEAFRQLIGNDAPGTAVERFHEISAEDAKALSRRRSLPSDVRVVDGHSSATSAAASRWCRLIERGTEANQYDAQRMMIARNEKNAMQVATECRSTR